MSKELELDQNESILLLGILQGHMDFIVRDITKLGKESEEVKIFYIKMLLETRDIYEKVVKGLK